MNCPNCDQPFTLRYDYARHLQDCRPADAAGVRIDPTQQPLRASLTSADERDLAAAPGSR